MSWTTLRRTSLIYIAPVFPSRDTVPFKFSWRVFYNIESLFAILKVVIGELYILVKTVYSVLDIYFIYIVFFK
jgi:hypothetical protein